MDWMTGRGGAGCDNVATRHYYYCVMRGSCTGMDYDYVIDVVAGSKACIAGCSAVRGPIFKTFKENLRKKLRKTFENLKKTRSQLPLLRKTYEKVTKR